jgi:methionyl-tRNA synthetase
MADELLSYYTAEQLRAHFIALGLSQKQASFRPKPLNPDAGEKDPDPVLKDGQVLTNILNRLARSCFYTTQSEFGGKMPIGSVDHELQSQAATAMLAFEAAMANCELHAANVIAADFCRAANKHWSEHSKATEADPAARRQLLIDCFYLLRVCLLLMHPIAPRGTKMVFDYLALDVSEFEFFSWKHVASDGTPAGFELFTGEKTTEWAIKELPPRTDFYPRHPREFE